MDTFEIRMFYELVMSCRICSVILGFSLRCSRNFKFLFILSLFFYALKVVQNPLKDTFLTMFRLECYQTLSKELTFKTAMKFIHFF